MRIEAQYAYSRIVYAEIALQRGLHQAQFGEYLFLCNPGWYILERNMSGDHSELDAVGNHQHSDVLHSEPALKVLGMARELKALTRH